MRKSTKIYLWAWCVVLATIIGAIIWPSHHDLARDPHNVGAIVNLRLPDISEYECGDNLDRGASRWDFYEYSATFAEEISERCIEEMERRCVEDSEHWSKNKEEGYYIYTDMGDDLYEVGCVIYKDEVHVGYLIDEDEGIFVFVVIFFLFKILIVWGLVLAILNSVSKRAARQMKQHELEKHNEVE